MNNQTTCTIPADIQEVRHCTDRLEQSLLNDDTEEGRAEVQQNVKEFKRVIKAFNDSSPLALTGLEYIAEVEESLKNLQKREIKCYFKNGRLNVI